jgi:putative effector of murein hydrolase LrgA (UPF0299 family)
MFWLPPFTAMVAGWVPRLLSRRPGPTRLLGAAGLFLYASVPVNTIPRLANASEHAITATTVVSTALMLAFASLLMSYCIKAQRASGS